MDIDLGSGWILYVVVVTAGFAAGFVNTLAGSGSLITLPLLIFMGLPATVANGTNRVAILVQNIVAVSSFRRQNMLDWRSGLSLAGPAALGALLGARIAVNMDNVMMERVIGALMVAMIGVILARPRRWLQMHATAREPPSTSGRLLTFFAIGVYGGFIQAGVGIFLLAGLVLSGQYDLLRGNAVKVLIVLCFTLVAMPVFVSNGQVNWEIGLTLALGTASGAWVAARTAVARGNRFVRWVLLGALLFSAANLFGVFGVIGAWLGV